MTYSYYRYITIFIALLLIATAIYCRIRLLDVPLERDEGGFAYIGQQLLRGVPPYHSGNMKVLPGIHFAYAGIMMLFGETASGIHTGLLAINIISILFMYLLARHLISTEAAAVAAGIFALLSVDKSVIGLFAHATHFVVLFVLGGLINLLKGIESKKNFHFFTSGLFFGISVLMKQHGIFFCMFAYYCLIGMSLKNKTASTVIIKVLLVFTAGLLIPYLLSCIYMYFNGVFKEYWYWTATYSIQYASNLSVAEALEAFRYYFQYIPLHVKFIWAGALVTILAITNNHKNIGLNKWIVFAFVIFSTLSIMPGFAFYPHYFVLMLPVLSLLVGIAYEILSRIVIPTYGIKLARLTVVITFISFVIFSFYRRYDYFFIRSPIDTSKTIYGMNPFPESTEIAKYLKKNSAPGTPIAVFGSEPQIYFYADRPSATDYLYMYPLVEQQPYVYAMQSEMIREIIESEPDYIVYVNISTSWMLSGDAGIKFLEWADNYLNQYYRQVGLVEMDSNNPSKYYWDKDAESRNPSTDFVIQIYKRV